MTSYIPQTADDLLKLADSIAGMSIENLSKSLGISLPDNFTNNKGFIGQLAEIALGAGAGSHPLQDFPVLGIELKTIPLNLSGKPAETTHVCILHQNCGQTFFKSNFYNKIKKVLWLPVEGCRKIPLNERHFGKAFLWNISDQETLELKQDWEEIMEYVSTGHLPELSAKTGVWMQVRPAGRNNGIKQYGYYLRKSFTERILLNEFAKNTD